LQLSGCSSYLSIIICVTGRIGIFEADSVFKLNGETHKKALGYEGAQLFDPSGKKRAMKEWIQIPFMYKEEWGNFAEKAMEYVIGK
jgi:hypothetical protein